MPVPAYGTFITVVLSFVIVAWAIFVMVKTINRLKREGRRPHRPSRPEEVKLLREIRDSLKKK